MYVPACGYVAVLVSTHCYASIDWQTSIDISAHLYRHGVATTRLQGGTN